MLKIEEPERTNLLGLILSNVIEKNLKDRRNSSLIKNFSGSINIKAGRMRSNITFNNGEVLIRQGFNNKADAEVHGTLNAFIDLGLKRRILKRFLKREVKIKGNIFKLFPLLKLLSL